MLPRSSQRGQSELMPPYALGPDCPPPTDAQVEAMYNALYAHDRAARAVAVELDYCLSMYPSFVIPTSLLLKMDAYREHAAMLLTYLSDDVPVVIAGPTQDQSPPSALRFEPGHIGEARLTSPLVAQLIQDCRDGLLTPEAAAALIAAAEEN